MLPSIYLIAYYIHLQLFNTLKRVQKRPATIAVWTWTLDGPVTFLRIRYTTSYYYIIQNSATKNQEKTCNLDLLILKKPFSSKIVQIVLLLASFTCNTFSPFFCKFFPFLADCCVYLRWISFNLQAIGPAINLTIG